VNRFLLCAIYLVVAATSLLFDLVHQIQKDFYSEPDLP